MLIIAGHVTVESDKQDEYVAAFRDMVQRVLAFNGCLDLAITADPVDPTRVDNFELWESEDAAICASLYIAALWGIAYSLDLRERIVEAVAEGQKPKDVAMRFKVGVATVGRYLSRSRTGELAAKPPPGRSVLIPPEAYDH